MEVNDVQNGVNICSFSAMQHTNECVIDFHLDFNLNGSQWLLQEVD